jgi:hypothetical protein
MKKYFSLVAVFLLAAIIGGYLLLRCSKTTPELRIITVAGTEQIFNYSRSDMNFGSVADSLELPALAVSDGDFLYILNEEFVSDFMMHYHESDGYNLAIESDTASPNELYLNGKLNSLYFSKHNDCTKVWDSKTLKELQSIILEGDSIPDVMPLLDEIAKVNPGIGVVINIYDQELFANIISLLKLKWIMVSGMLLGDMDETRLVTLKNLQNLIITEADSLSGDLFNQLPGLKNLLIMEWIRADTSITYFEKNRKLKSLSIFATDIKSLSELSLPGNLNSLYLVNCSLTDIDQIRSLHRLRNLSLAGCDTLMDISVLNEIPSLQWLSLPPKVSQESFDEIIKHHNSLQALELVGCKEVSDLSSLKQLKGLKALSLDLPEIDFESLKQLTNVELIVIKQNWFEESASEIAGLKEALPGTHIIPGSGVCMGSGWILLFIPVLLIIAFVRMFLRRYNG